MKKSKTKRGLFQALKRREDTPVRKEYHKRQQLTMSELGLSLEELAARCRRS